MHLQFVESESTFDYFAATRAYLERYGKPVAFYSDKHSVFRVNKKDAVGGDGMTQFGRALHALNIDIICANSSQAKGRVERANGTLQDRLVKEMRLSGRATGDPIPRRRSTLPHLRQTAAGQPGSDCREQAPGSNPGLHRRAAKETRHVPLGQGAAATWPEEPHVQGRIDEHPGVALRNVKGFTRRPLEK